MRESDAPSTGLRFSVRILQFILRVMGRYGSG